MTIPTKLPRDITSGFHVSSLEQLGFEVTVRDLLETELPPPPPPSFNPIGVNLAPLVYYGSEIPFNDVARTMSPWISQTDSHTPWDTKVPLDLDANGNLLSLGVGKAAGVLIHRSIGSHYPGGNYICKYDGIGTLQWKFASAVLKSEPGLEVINVAPASGGIYMKILDVDPNNPIRNIRLYLPGTEGLASRWREGFLDRWSEFKVFRFMDWQRTNNSELSKWSDRTTLDSVTQDNIKGVALKHMIDLCNETGTDPWFCIPHLADNEFVTEFATMCNGLLDSNRHLFIEHSNEVWNTQFSQAEYAMKQGLTLGLDTNSHAARLKYHAQRTVTIGSIFKTLMGLDRVTVVLGSQAASLWVSNTMLGHQFLGKPIVEQVDALAIAPYIGIKETDAHATMSNAEILGELEANIPTVANYTKIHSIAAGSLPLFAYEGGQHMVGSGSLQNNELLTAKLISVNNDPRMQSVYEKYLAAWKDNGGKLFMHYSSIREHDKHGSWGTAEYYDSPATGKYLAMLDYARGV